MTPTHGKPSTYKNHKCRCEPCTTANREAQRKFRGSLETASVAVPRSDRARAVNRLIARHPDEFRELINEEIAHMTEPQYAWTCEQWGHNDKCRIGRCDCGCHVEEDDDE